MTTFGLWCGSIGISLGLITTLSQLIRVYRHGTEGVSIATWTMFATMGTFWVAYGMAIHSWMVIGGSLYIWPFQVWVIAKLSPLANANIVIRSALTVVVMTWAMALIGGWNLGLIGTGLAMSWNRVPQTLALIRSKTAEGVSVTTWLGGAVAAGLWMVYYVADHHWFALVATAMAGVGNIVITVLALLRHHQARRA